MVVYKLFRLKDGKLYPLYVEAKRKMEIGVWLKARVGELADDSHVRAAGCGGKLALRPGFHSTSVPFTDWIGKKHPTQKGVLIQRADTVWCECEIRGKEVKVKDKNGSKEIIEGWYRFKTNSKQKGKLNREPWYISSEIKINRILSQKEVKELCRAKGIEPQLHENELIENLPLFKIAA